MERMVPVSDGHMYTMREWTDLVTTQTLTDLDGFGLYCNGEEALYGRMLYPTLLERSLVDTSWSHVLWYGTVK